MDEAKLRQYIGANIASYRKRAGLTQVGLAEQLNYSDKAVSKWERGESVPDVMTLAALAQCLGITVNDLMTDPNALPEEKGAVQQVVTKVVEKRLKRKANKKVILALTTTLVWSIALLVYVVLSSLELPNSWVAFFYAVPVNAIVSLSLRSAWHDFRWNRMLISTIVWGSLMSIFISLWAFCRVNVWRVFLLGIPGQIAVLLWFRLFRNIGEEEQIDG